MGARGLARTVGDGAGNLGMLTIGQLAETLMFVSDEVNKKGSPEDFVVLSFAPKGNAVTHFSSVFKRKAYGAGVLRPPQPPPACR